MACSRNLTKILNLIFGLSYGCRPYNFWMKIIFQQKLPKSDFFLANKKIFLINIFRSQSNHLKEFTMQYQKKILNLIFGLSCGRSTYHLLNENYLPGKIGQNCKKVIFFDQIKNIFLINIFWTSGTQKIEFCMLYQEKILNLRFGLSCGRRRALHQHR